MKKLILSWLLLGSCGGMLSWAQETPPPVDEAAEVPEPEPLLRGPVHEAFAEPIASGDEEPFVVPKEPPPQVEEIAPDAKPEGERVQWIPGYWSWDGERNDYIWVSGVWRKAPVGRTWAPGHWEQVGDGYQWIAGRWMSEAQPESEVLPTPPPTLEQGPTSEAESDNVFWIPGSWQYRDTRYVWRPGFWSRSYSNWMWVPDHYVTTINGCYYVPGYWDYPWETRGVLYAPYYISPRLIHSGYRFRPWYTVDLAGAFFHLWVNPGYRHYYYGDYYDPWYTSRGFYPWYNYPFSYRSGYDPLFSFYYWDFHRHHHIDLHRHLHNRHHYYRQHADARPPRRHDRGPGRGGPGGRGGRENIRLTNAQREALVRNTAERETRAINLNQREAIRGRLLAQHQERLRTGGQSLADSPAADGRRVERPSNADVLMRGAGRRRLAGAGPRAGGPAARSQDGRQVDGRARQRASAAADRARPDPRAVQPGGPRSRVGIPTAREQARDRAISQERSTVQRQAAERERGGGGAQPVPGRAQALRGQPSEAVGGTRSAPTRRQDPRSVGAPGRPEGRVAGPEGGRVARPRASQQLEPGIPAARAIPDARPRASGGPPAAARRSAPIPTSRSFNASGRAPSAGPAMRSAPRPTPQMSRPAPQMSRPAPQMSRPAPRPAPAMRQAPSRGPSPRAQQMQRSFNRRGRN